MRSLCELVVPGCERVGRRGLRRRAAGADARRRARGRARGLRGAGRLRRGRRGGAARAPVHRRVRAGARVGVRGVLQRLRGARAPPARARRRRSTSASRWPTASTRTGRIWGWGHEAERFDVVVVGSGAGGGLVAGEVADSGASVLLLEAGPHRTAADFTRWEAHANHDIWFAPTLVEPRAEGAPPLVVIRGRCVGGTSTVNTKVALRPSDQDYAKWHAAAGLVGRGRRPVLRRRHGAPLRARRGAARGAGAVRLADSASTRWPRALQAHGRRAGAGHVLHGRQLHALRLLPAGVPDQRRQELDERLHPSAVGGGAADAARRVHGDAGASSRTADRARRRPAWSTSTPDGQCARRRGRASSWWPPGRWAPRTCCCARASARRPAARPARSSSAATSAGTRRGSSCGLFDEPQDAHRVYPISAHCMKFQSDDDGGFIVEAATIQDPIGFSVMLCDEDGVPMWGRRAERDGAPVPVLQRAADDGHRPEQRHGLDRRGRPRPLLVRVQRGRARARRGLVAVRPRGAAGRRRPARAARRASRSTHVQGGCRMGSDPERSVVDAHGESHDVRRLFVGDSSVVPTHAVGQPVADDHVAGQPAGRVSGRRRARLLRGRRAGLRVRVRVRSGPQ